MRSVIDHFKGSRDFPRLRIGMFLIEPRLLPLWSFCMYNSIDKSVKSFQALAGLPGRWILSTLFFVHLLNKSVKRYVKVFTLHCSIEYFKHWKLNSNFSETKLLLQLNFSFQHGVEALRILLLKGFDKSATFVNSNRPLEQLG